MLRSILVKGTLLCIAVLCLSSMLAAQRDRVAESETSAKVPVTKLEIIDRKQTWPDEDVRWIITPQERRAWDTLGSADERDQFVEQFWRRRDPSPDTLENEFKEEHYRRLAYSNERFAARIPGWETDRGRIYVLYGKPDEVISQSLVEIWKYHSLAYGRGTDVELRFADRCQCNDYKLQAPGIPNLLDPPPVPDVP